MPDGREGCRQVSSPEAPPCSVGSQRAELDQWPGGAVTERHSMRKLPWQRYELVRGFGTFSLRVGWV